MPADHEVIHATVNDIEAIAPLFDQYRVWYGMESDLNGARNFLSHRLQNSESVVFLAVVDTTPVAFAQLYPLFSSVSMESVWLLNDLFVSEANRKQGIGTTMLETVAQFGRETGALRMELATEVDNFAAQTLYKSRGWQQNETFLHYSLPLTD
ncbi:MAG: GNAT family N-acetyltransferase [Fuerstiella sp.]|jgi:GNAT superfamily N-acetyltransferase|nr:GNAT family N-acetyltransferase [Fuerstiella sp.]MCP4506378.1 GNAT family N-acetyltransferase [Fuerstiella sp.]MDG2127029.1 GNAT family N-acetyltransferase [Fuerstiella sp.]